MVDHRNLNKTLHICYIPENGHLQSGLETKLVNRKICRILLCISWKDANAIQELNRVVKSTFFLDLIFHLGYKNIVGLLYLATVIQRCFEPELCNCFHLNYVESSFLQNFCLNNSRHYFMHLNIIGIFRLDQKARNTCANQ